MFAQHNQNNMHNWNFLVANACEHIQKQSIGKECHSTVFGGDFTVTCSSFTYNSETVPVCLRFWPPRLLFPSRLVWTQETQTGSSNPLGTRKCWACFCCSVSWIGDCCRGWNGCCWCSGGPSPPASFASCASQILTPASPFHICPRERLVEAFVRQEVISHVLLSWPSMLL